MEALLYLISDKDGVQYLPVKQRIIIGGRDDNNNDRSLRRTWLNTGCLDIFPSDNGWGIMRNEGPQRITMNGMELPAGESFLLADNSVIMMASPDMQDYFIILFRMQMDFAEMKWQKSTFGEFQVGRLLPFACENGQWKVYPNRTDLKVIGQRGTVITNPENVYAGTVYIVGSRLIAVMRDGLLYTDDAPAPVQNGNSAMGGCHEDGILRIDIKERSVKKLFGKKKLLQDIHLDMKKGQMVLILGQSGAGKSTFINAVIGFEKADGTITYNGKTIDEIRDTDRSIGFVPQGDLLRPGMTVYKTIMGAARLKYAESFSQNSDAIKEKVERTLKQMGLTEKRKELVGKLSGGEKKRLAVAMEYVGDPELFLLDEPDSGLDGASANDLMALLRSIADEGRIVVLISHSPDRGGSMFDRIMVLAKSQQTQCGRLAFYGSYDKTLEFFDVNGLEGVVGALGSGENNKADYYIQKYADCKAGREGVE